jgi:hypothetical protein
MSIITKDRILGNAQEAYAYYGKKMLGWIREKMATQELAPGGGRFFASNSTVVGNNALACSDSCVPSKDCSTATGNDS